MATITEMIEAAKSCCRKSASSKDKHRSYEEMFGGKWEVFVIKKDKITGNFTGKLACCALSPV
jgi:hypothetical protein